MYQIKCAGCEAAYVGQTRRYLATLFKEHLKCKSTVAEHMTTCGGEIEMNQVRVLERGAGEEQLKTLEALCIHELKPSLNTQEDYRNRTLTLKLF